MKRGLDAFAHTEYEEARAAFAQAYALAPVAATLFNLALAELQSGHPLEAAGHLRTYVQSPDALPDKVDAVRSKLLPRAEAQIARIEVTGGEGSEIAIDGIRVGENLVGSKTVEVNAGSHDVLARMGGWSRSAHVEVEAGRVSRVQFENPPAPAALPQPAQPVQNDVRRPSPAKVAAVITAGSLAVSCAAIAIGFQVVSNGDGETKATALAQLGSRSCGTPGEPVECGTVRDAAYAQADNANRAIGFTISAGGLAAATVITWLVWPNSPRSGASTPSRGWRVTPVIATATAAGVLAVADF